MDLAVKIVVLAIVVESTVEALKNIWSKGKLNWIQILALGVGLSLAIATRTDLLEMFNITSTTPIIGMVVTGVLISRGGNATHDLLDKLREGGNKNEQNV